MLNRKFNMSPGLIHPIPDINTAFKKIQEIRFLSQNTFIIRFDRDDIHFIPGQHVIVGLKGSMDQREYSIYSSDKENYLEILVKAVTDGKLSLQLKAAKPGELLNVNGPFGSFKLEKKDVYPGKHIFIATGSGISPFHSFVTSYPGIDYTVFHGIRHKNESFVTYDFDPERYIACVSREENGKYTGRVTRFLPGYRDEPGTCYYLCGNSSMIYEVTHILRNNGVSVDRILTEVYF